MFAELYTHAHARTHNSFNPLKAELNPICHPLALLGAHPILHVSRIKVKTQRRLISYSYNSKHNNRVI